MKEFLQPQFDEFHDNIKLDNLEDFKELREKRDMLLQEIKDWLAKNEKPSFDSFSQGSYAMNTGNVSMEGEDYDLDIGLEFRLSIEDYKPVEVKQWVYDALNAKAFRTVEMKTPCVRVQYHKEGDPKFHIDFAIYGRTDKDKPKENLHLAKGKPSSSSENKKWEPAEPPSLKDKVSKHFSEPAEAAQMRRCIRYMKRWKDNKFADNNGRPTGIAMTSMALQWFQPRVKDPISSQEKISDLKAMKAWVEAIYNHNYGLGTRLPVTPYNDLFAKIKAAEGHLENYKNRLTKLREALQDAVGKTDAHDAAAILQKHFGDDFPVPDKEQSARVSGRPAIAPAVGSA